MNHEEPKGDAAARIARMLSPATCPTWLAIGVIAATTFIVGAAGGSIVLWALYQYDATYDQALDADDSDAD